MLPIESSKTETDAAPRNEPAEPNPDRQNPVDPDVENRRLSRIYIATILAVGLLIAAGYVGTRIFAGKSHHPGPSHEATSKPANSTTPAPSIAPVLAEKAPPAEDPKPEPTPPVQAAAPEHPSADAEGFVTPQHGERYLQVAALSTPTVSRYIAELKRSQLEAVVVPGPRPGLVRILIGPFPDRETLESVRAQIETLGVSPFVRSY